MSKTIASGIFIVRKDKKILICHPTNHKKDFWSIPKGKVDKGETLLDAALRETYEETNINLKNNYNFAIHVLPSVNYSHNKKVINSFVYLESQESTMDWSTIEIKCNSNVPLDRGGFPEMDEYQWINIEDAKPLLHETQAASIDKVLEISKELSLS
jgi:8-oxo-dGTP pyrophosphatase MutT (NUDIX family)